MADSGGDPRNRILILGTGALGTYFAARLAGAGYEVTLLGSWQLGLDALRQNGVRLVDEHSREHVFAVRVADTPDQCRGVTQAIVLRKAWQTERAAAQLAACLSEDGLALTLQNGLGNYEILEAGLGKERVALGTTTAGATLLGPGLVKPAGNGGISIQSHPGMTPIESALRAAGFHVDVVQDAQALMWGKLVVNSAINPLTALLRIPNGDLLQRPAARALMRCLAEETAAVASALGVKLNFTDPAGHVERVAQQTATNYSSMLQDVMRGAPTEIDAICGAVTRTGRRLGVPTPVNEACWQLIQATVP